MIPAVRERALTIIAAVCASVVVATAQVPPQLQAPSAAHLAGRVVDEAGKPFAGAQFEGKVAGTVRDATTKQPLAGAAVSLSGVGVRRTTIADSRGVFEFSGVGTGQVLVEASSPGFLPGGYPGYSPFEGAFRLDRRSGSELTTVAVLLWPGATLSGHVATTDGQPVGGAEIVAQRFVAVGGLPRVTDQGAIGRTRTRTDDRGYYRMADLLPGRYWVRCSRASGDVLTPASEEITFYPDRASPSSAIALEVSAGQDLPNVDIRVESAGRFVLNGRVESRGDMPRSPLIHLISTDVADLPSGYLLQSVVATNGMFVFEHVPRGSYRVEFVDVPGHLGQQVSTGMVLRNQVSRSGESQPAGKTLWGRESIDLPADHGIHLVVREGIRIRGSVLVRGSADVTSQAPAGLPILVTGSSGQPLPQLPATSTQADGTFETIGLPHGRYVLALPVLPIGWNVISVSQAGRELVSDSVELGNTFDDPVQITLTTQPALIEGVVSTPSAPVSGAMVYVFPVDQTSWTGYGAVSNRLREIRPDHEGRYQFAGLPPGRYFLVASTAPRQENWRLPSSLLRLASVGERIEIRLSERQTRDLVAR